MTTSTRLRTLHRSHALLTVMTLAVLLTLRLSGVLDDATAVVLFLAIEIPLTALLLVMTWLRFSRSRVRGAGEGRPLLDRIAADEPLLGPAVAEMRMLASIGLLLTGRRRVPAGAVAFGYTRRTLAIPSALIAVSIVELVIVHLLVPWTWLRITLLVLTAWGVLFLVGSLASRVVNPHYVTRDALHLRWGLTEVLAVDRADVVDVVLHADHSATQPEIRDDRLILTAFQSTNVLVRFTAPVAADAPVPKKQRPRNLHVREVSLHIDEPDAFVSTLAATPRPASSMEGSMDER